MFATTSSLRARRQHSARPTIEALEDRVVPAITFHGGPVMPNVEVQGLFYGSDWSSNLTLKGQSTTFSNFLNNVVHSSFMDMLTTAGYGVGRGTFSPSAFDLKALNATTLAATGGFLTDANIQKEVQADIRSGLVTAPDANRLYVVFVQDNVAIQIAPGQTSQNAFLGYHFAFNGTNALGQAMSIRYAVIAYPGGTVNNAGVSWLNTVDTMTTVTSHELAEAVTDPVPNTGWNDTTVVDGEVGDIVAHQDVYLNGFAVQRISDKNDQAMTPAGATAGVAESFVLGTNHNLFRHTAAGLTLVPPPLPGVQFASISDQTIDNEGRVMVDAVTTTGSAYEFHDGVGFGSGWTLLTTGAVSAKASQGFSYVLLSGGTLKEFKDVAALSAASSKIVATGVASFDAGTDRFGVSMVDMVLTTGVAQEFSNSTGLHTLGAGIKAVSAGKQGTSIVLSTLGKASRFNEATGTLTLLASGVKQATAGVDAAGNAVIDLLSTTGVLTEMRTGLVTRTVASGVQSLGKAHAGLVDVVFGTGLAEEFSLAGGTVLGSGALTAA